MMNDEGKYRMMKVNTENTGCYFSEMVRKTCFQF